MKSTPCCFLRTDAVYWERRSHCVGSVCCVDGTCVYPQPRPGHTDAIPVYCWVLLFLAGGGGEKNVNIL